MEMIETDDDIHIDSLYTKQIMNMWISIQEFETHTNDAKSVEGIQYQAGRNKNGTTYSILSKVAKDIFGITATSIPAEKLFSKTSLENIELVERNIGTYNFMYKFLVDL